MGFVWDEVAILEFFGVLPEESDEFGRDLVFDVGEPQVRLKFGVNVDTGDCSVVVETSGLRVFEAVYLASPGAQVVNDKRGHFLEIGAPGSVEASYDGGKPFVSGLRITLEPHIHVTHFVV